VTTAEALERMGDAGEFEILALRALRILEEDCRAVIHLGVNPQGKTIPNPVDGLCLVPGSNPPKYVLTAFTLCKNAELKRKWLFDRTAVAAEAAPKTGSSASSREDGDLVKAARYAAKLREATPNAQFIVDLCTNRIPGTDLMGEVYSKADAFGIEARLLEGSRLRDFLDSIPEGQWLRQEHLGIEADQLSRPLLQRLSRDILDRFAAEMLLTSPAVIVQTRAAKEAREAMRQPTLFVHALVGPSGVGKTVVAFDTLRQHIETGGIGVWVSREISERASTLPEAIEEVLRASHPKLQKGAGQTAVRFGTVESPILVVIDDLNRSSAASNLIQKIVGWARLAHGRDNSGKAPPSSVRLLCPIWDSYYQANRHLLEPTDWLGVQTLGPMLRAESVECLRVALGTLADRFGDVELSHFAEALKDDAILLGLFAQNLIRQPEANPTALSQDVIGHLVKQAVSEVAAKTGFAAAQYTFALRQISSEMIRRKTLYPKWSALEGWFGSRPQIATLLSQLAAQGAICWVSDSDGSGQFQFRHDRILEYHLRAALCEMLAQDYPPDDSVWDPFFTPHLAWALARGAQAPRILELAMGRNPVALVAAIEHLSSVPSHNESAVLTKARDWLGTASQALPSVRDHAYGVLASVESPHLLALTEGLETDRRLLFGRLRNGDAAAGAQVLSEEFYPAIRHPWLEALIRQAKFRHGPELVGRLKELLALQDLDDPVRSGALVLAGYLGEDSLGAAVRVAWENAQDRNRFLLETLWASLRCSTNAPEELLSPVFGAIMELEDEDHGGHLSDRQRLLEETCFAARHGFSEEVLKFLTELGQSEEYQGIVAAILNGVDHPIAVDFVVRKLAFFSHRAKERGGFSPWAFSWTDRWTRGEGEGPIPLSRASTDALRSLWQEESNPDWLKEYALGVWARIEGDLPHLRSISEKSALYATALWHRALRGDRTTASQVAGKVNEKTWWLWLVPKIWCKEIAEVVDYHLSLAERDDNPWNNRHYELAHTLRDIPVCDAEPLLLKHWPSLSRKPLFIQAALYLSTLESRARAAESIRSLGMKREIFEHVSFFFGFMNSGLSDGLSVLHLDSLRPFLPCLDSMCIHDMLEFCRRHGYWDWALEVLQPECSRRAKAAETREHNKFDWDPNLSKWYFPTDADLLEALGRAEKADPRQRFADLWRWSHEFLERGDSLTRLFRIAKEWLGVSPSLERYKMVASLIEEHGTRSHLKILQACQPICKSTDGRSTLADVSHAVRRRSLS
jgi:hypothetical protein